MKVIRSIIFAATLCAILMTMLTPISAAEIKPVDPLAYSAHTNIGFKYINDGIKYIQPNGTYLKNSWVTVGSQAWCFDANGNMLMGFYVIDNHLWGLTYEGVATLMDPAMPMAPVSKVAPSAAPIITAMPAPECVVK